MVLHYALITHLILLAANPFEVFFSCRGNDTRTSFTDHLFSAFVQAGIRTFREDDGIPVGENIGVAIKRAIYETKVSVIVFSKEYAASRRCLDELRMIMDRRIIDGYIVIPVYYHVDPYDLADLTGVYGEAFEEYAKMFKDKMDRVEEWKAALKEVADLKGMVLDNRYESEFVKHVVEEIENKLKQQVPDVASNSSWKLVSLFKLMCSLLLIIMLVFFSEIKKAIYASGIWAIAAANGCASWICKHCQHIMNRPWKAVGHILRWSIFGKEVPQEGDGQGISKDKIT